MDAFSRVVAQAATRDEFLSAEQIEALKAIATSGEKRIDVVNCITSNASAIVTNAARALFAEQPQLIAPGGNAYTSRRNAACLRDMEIILRYISYSIFTGDASVLEDRCLNGLRETYIALGVPGASVAVSIQKMKEASLKLLIEPQTQKSLQESSKDLALLEIRKLYPKQWVTIEITKFEGGFPSRGKVLFYDSDITTLSNKISKLRGDIYTFFTSRIDEKPDSEFKEKIYKNKEYSQITSSLTSEYSDLISELSSYFDRAMASVS